MNTLSQDSEQLWWKWGDPSKSFHLNDFPLFKVFLEEQWNTKLIENFRAPVNITPANESQFTAKSIAQALPELKSKQITIEDVDRIKYTLGKSYHDIIRIFTGDEIFSPDAVLFPESIKDVEHILKQASDHKIDIIPFSGGSNVTGAFSINKKQRPVCALNLQHLNQLLEIDHEALTATFECGIFGPQLEEILNKEGYTLGHFPQSFEYSTLGGWLATRSAGQESGTYGKIEDIVLGIKSVTPTGTQTTTDFPRHASGIDTYRLFVGSEGTLGVITEAKVRIHKKPKEFRWVVSLFKNFKSGSAAVKEMVQQGIHPSLVRLSDPGETAMMSKMSREEKSGLTKFISEMMKKYIKSKGYGHPCILMMRTAINSSIDIEALKICKSVCKKNDGFLLPDSAAGNWEEHRFSLPYLRETLIEHRVMIDTFETVTYWDNVMNLYNKVHEELGTKSDYFKKGGLLFCHLSHVYENGSSLYFTLLSPQEKDNELEQWKAIKQIVTDAVVNNGGAVSHHHGVGADHRKWYLETLDPNERKLLNAIKDYLDPNHILNPGKLFDESKGN